VGLLDKSKSHPIVKKQEEKEENEVEIEEAIQRPKFSDEDGTRKWKHEGQNTLYNPVQHSTIISEFIGFAACHCLPRNAVREQEW
jgi:hypothetical protein